MTVIIKKLKNTIQTYLCATCLKMDPDCMIHDALCEHFCTTIWYVAYDESSKNEGQPKGK